MIGHSKKADERELKIEIKNYNEQMTAISVVHQVNISNSN